MPNATRNEQPLESKVGGALQPLTSIRPVGCSEMQFHLFRTSLFWYQLLLTLSQFCTGCPTGEGSIPLVLQPAPSPGQQQALAPAILRQQNKAGKTQAKPQWYKCPRPEHPAEAPEKFILPHGRGGSPQPRFQLKFVKPKPL